MTISIDSFIDELQKIASTKTKQAMNPILERMLMMGGVGGAMGGMTGGMLRRPDQDFNFRGMAQGGLAGAGIGSLAGLIPHEGVGFPLAAMGGGIGGMAGGQAGLSPEEQDLWAKAMADEEEELAAEEAAKSGGSKDPEKTSAQKCRAGSMPIRAANLASKSSYDGQNKKLTKLAGLADMAGKAMATMGKPGVLKNMALVGAGGAGALAGDQAIKDWSLGRQIRQQQMQGR